MKPRRLLVPLVALLFLSIDAPAQVPACTAVPGWQQSGPARSYTRENLFDYMNGNSEGYFIYGFSVMKGVTCKAGADTLVIDLSEMGGADTAWGMFMANRDQRRPIEKIGAAGQVGGRKATFAKGRYYLEISASPDKDHSSALRAFVTAFERQLEGETALPEPVAWFPPESLEPDSVRLVPESVLGLRILKSGYVGQYGFGKAFLIIEPSPEAAAQLMTKWKARIGETAPAALADEAFTATDRYLDGLVVFRKGRFVAGYANVKGGRDLKAEAARFASRLP